MIVLVRYKRAHCAIRIDTNSIEFLTWCAAMMVKGCSKGSIAKKIGLRALPLSVLTGLRKLMCDAIGVDQHDLARKEQPRSGTRPIAIEHLVSPGLYRICSGLPMGRIDMRASKVWPYCRPPLGDVSVITREVA